MHVNPPIPFSSNAENLSTRMYCQNASYHIGVHGPTPKVLAINDPSFRTLRMSQGIFIWCMNLLIVFALGKSSR